MEMLDERIVEAQPGREERELGPLRGVVDIDREERRGVDFGGLFRVSRRSRDCVDVERCAELVHHERLVVGVEIELVHLGEDGGLLLCVDLAVGFGGRDHRPKQPLADRLLAGVVVRQEA
jgi:hypothetical protein